MGEKVIDEGIVWLVFKADCSWRPCVWNFGRATACIIGVPLASVPICTSRCAILLRRRSFLEFVLRSGDPRLLRLGEDGCRRVDVGWIEEPAADLRLCLGVSSPAGGNPSSGSHHSTSTATATLGSLWRAGDAVEESTGLCDGPAIASVLTLSGCSKGTDVVSDSNGAAGRGASVNLAANFFETFGFSVWDSVGGLVGAPVSVSG